jgi:hypothetical protein
MLQILKKWSLKILSDVHSTIVSLIVLGSVLAFGGIVAIYKNLRLFLFEILQKPTPLWTTILLVLVCGLLIYRKFCSFQSLSRPSTSLVRIKKLDDQDIKVLHLIAIIENSFINSCGDDKSIDEDYISKTLQISPQTTKYYLEKLVNAHYIYYDGYNDLKGLTNKGRTFLKENNMLP